MLLHRGPRRSSLVVFAPLGDREQFASTESQTATDVAHRQCPPSCGGPDRGLAHAKQLRGIAHIEESVVEVISPKVSELRGEDVADRGRYHALDLLFESHVPSMRPGTSTFRYS